MDRSKYAHGIEYSDKKRRKEKKRVSNETTL
jgi:hypothetical protein